MIKQKKKGFTLLELIVVMAIIGILVLLAMPKFMGYTEKARLTKIIVNSSELEKASERYYMDKEDWPRLSDEYYSAEEIETFAEKIHDKTGAIIVLDPNGKYYDIDYNKLNNYVKVSDNKEYYIIQNPVGNIYTLENLTEEAKTRLDAKYILTFIASDGGTVSSSNQMINKYGSSNPVTATANSGYEFLQWVDSKGKVISTDVTISLSDVKESETYTAEFRGQYVWKKYNIVTETDVVTAVSSEKVENLPTYYNVPGGDLYFTAYYVSSTPYKIGDKITLGMPSQLRINFMTLQRSIAFAASGTSVKHVSGSGQLTYQNGTYYVPCITYTLGTLNKQGTTDYGLIYSSSLTDYPNNGEKDGYWYIKQ